MLVSAFSSRDHILHAYRHAVERDIASSLSAMPCSLQEKNERKLRRDVPKAIGRDSQVGKRPTLFLHACCGPCLCYPLSILLDDFDVTVGFINPNIRPLAEYEKRNRTLQFFLQRYVRDRGKNVSFVLVPEDFEGYDEKMKGGKKDRKAERTACFATPTAFPSYPLRP